MEWVLALMVLESRRKPRATQVKRTYRTICEKRAEEAQEIKHRCCDVIGYKSLLFSKEPLAFITLGIMACGHVCTVPT